MFMKIVNEELVIKLGDNKQEYTWDEFLDKYEDPEVEKMVQNNPFIGQTVEAEPSVLKVKGATKIGVPENERVISTGETVRKKVI